MYSLYVSIYIQEIELRHLSRYRATTSGLKNIYLLFKFLWLAEKLFLRAVIWTTLFN